MEYDEAGQLIKETNPLGYDAFGNRTRMTEGDRETAYTYNAMNQLMSRMDSMSEETYAYDRRGNLSLIMENGTMKNSYTYGALNRLEQAVNGKGEAAAYEYNGLGHRVGKTITSATEPATPDPMGRLKEQSPDPETKIRYTIDLTRGYHNLLEKEEAGSRQTYLWDGNVAGMKEEAENNCYYFQDELGSPVRLINEEGSLQETYGYDEFGQDLYGNQGELQPFGYTGYQSDRTAGTYYAQAREYRAELGRFAGVDIIKGYTAAPYTLNEYGYCWGNPMILVDLNGMWVQFVIGAVVGAVISTGFEIYDQYKSGTLDFKSGKTWGKIGVSFAAGAIEGVAVASGNIAIAASAVTATEFLASTAKDAIDGKEITTDVLRHNLADASFSGILTFISMGIGRYLGKLLPKLASNLIGQDELSDDMLHWLIKYAMEGHPDSNIALEIIGQYIGQEAFFGIIESIIGSGFGIFSNAIFECAE